jgi:hypothetical protein
VLEALWSKRQGQRERERERERDRDRDRRERDIERSKWLIVFKLE